MDGNPKYVVEEVDPAPSTSDHISSLDEMDSLKASHKAAEENLMKSIKKSFEFQIPSSLYLYQNILDKLDESTKQAFRESISKGIFPYLGVSQKESSETSQNYLTGELAESVKRFMQDKTYMKRFPDEVKVFASKLKVQQNDQRNLDLVLERIEEFLQQENLQYELVPSLIVVMGLLNSSPIFGLINRCIIV
jgi:hypothetical protein